MKTDLDRIERHITINASAERVWDLISIPGWFINDGTIIDHTIETRGEVHIVHDPVHGKFKLTTVELDKPRYAAFRWHTDTTRLDDSTLVEFWIEESPQGGVTLRVIESGFASLRMSEEQRQLRIKSNKDGWEEELIAARIYLTGSDDDDA
ncbi:SRPBCC domain-containing protein [Hoyosella rhizosphaerae]|uniref:Toxin n=1 Tax=Hoyosella rhizosphaerae TaxID=1755582 RepID=A0A916U0Y6_9ACTN|nr:SRPBCC domain-containing protein [Hoyosella rhizosphaerae]MBN4926821.1 SRPBCC domain-containing protein [Hoyosella rhizosphaerae]GGC56220.1 toxin [Hoyosella rhizosphaerae]